MTPLRSKKKMSRDAEGGKPAHPEKAKFLLAADEAQKLVNTAGPLTLIFWKQLIAR
jgi:hypothetical protein